MKKTKGRSVKSWLIECFYRIMRVKQKLSQKKKVFKFIEYRRQKNKKPYKKPIFLKLKSSVTKETVNNMDVYSLNRNDDTHQKHILYLHGGGYLSQPIRMHWKFLDTVAKKTNSEVTFPIYPLAPNHTYVDAFDKIMTVYKRLLKRTDSTNITIMGDSAGGGLSLAFSQVLLEKGYPQVSKIILISPWLDITMKNPEINQLERKDPLLATYGLIQMGKSWAGETDPSHHLLSPINGELKGLGHMTLFVGTHELFLSDVRKLKDLLTAQGLKVNYFEYPKMNHAFPLYPIREAREATSQMINIINCDD